MTDPAPKTPVSETDAPSTQTQLGTSRPADPSPGGAAPDGDTHGRPSDDSDPGHS